MTRSRWFQLMLSVLFVCACCIPALAQSLDHAQLEKEINAAYEQIKAKEALFLDVSAEDKAAYGEFLKQPNTGLIRLLPKEKFYNKLSIRGGGAYYSFARLSHEDAHASDIELQFNLLSVGFAGMDFGFFALLDDLRLEEVSLNHPTVKTLAEYKPPQMGPEIRAQNQQSYDGVEIGGLTYTRYVTAQVGSTYVLRSISYPNSDLLVAFHIVRQDDDESLILLWKMLKKFPAPKAIWQTQDR
jgi:hypothetical protein